MKAIFEKFFSMFFIVFAWPLMSATISGTVKDSSTGKPIVGAQARCNAPVCSTQTDAEGKFTLNIPMTKTIPFSIPPVMKISFDPSHNLFYGNSKEDFSIAVRNVKGEVVAKGDKLSPGEYFASWRTTGSSGVFKFSNIAGQRWFFIPNCSEKRGVAKTMAGYTVNFIAPSYTPKTVTLSLGQNVQIDLAQVTTTGSISISDSLGHVGQTGFNIIVPAVSPSP
jgi:hypothetical protein